MTRKMWLLLMSQPIVSNVAAEKSTQQAFAELLSSWRATVAAHREATISWMSSNSPCRRTKVNCEL